MLQLTANAAAYLRNVLPEPATGDSRRRDVLRVAPTTGDEMCGLKVSFVTYPGEHDSVSASHGIYLCVDPELVGELTDKLIDVSPDGESVCIRTA